MGEMMTLAQLPAGARQMPRTGKPLHGKELADGLVRLARRVAGSQTATLLEVAVAGQQWAQEHKTFPRASVLWTGCEGGGLWLRVELGQGKHWEWGWRDESADVRGMQQLGPCERPDDLREALGLAMGVKFRLGDGAVVTVDVSPQVQADPPRIGPISEDHPAPVLPSITEPLKVSDAELLAEPPTPPVKAPAAAPAKPTGAQIVKGGRK